jgi:hypothetical protein
VGNGWAVGWVAFVGNVAYPQLPTALCGDDSCADLLFDTQAARLRCCRAGWKDQGGESPPRSADTSSTRASIFVHWPCDRIQKQPAKSAGWAAQGHSAASSGVFSTSLNPVRQLPTRSVRRYGESSPHATIGRNSCRQCEEIVDAGHPGAQIPAPAELAEAWVAIRAVYRRPHPERAFPCAPARIFQSSELWRR